MTSMPPGWYDDQRGALRWWDGTQWTEHVATPDPEPEAGAEPIDEIIPPELQDEYPAGYPGAEATGPSGAFVAATEPAKSKLWILWVVLGVVLLGIVIAAAVALPLLFLSLTRGSAGGDSVAPQGDAQAAAVAAVELYDEAWQTADCGLLEESTTQAFREDNGLTDCADFTENAQAFAEGFDEYVLTVTGVSEDDDVVSVDTRESYVTYIDDEGELVEEPIPGEVEWTYTVVQEGDRWAVDGLD
ncbi:hypothetical protein GCM10009775_29670 [Microbacterium aoyamense]|uniref:DUF2510 domain-containing protein n=1 Tax=Microbacterium aoyamense TaxID=344166 RepID=A0ABP5BA11_9MICO|nr:DUF2510 domain-containing protein [Microbacterium aoyamense]